MADIRLFYPGVNTLVESVVNTPPTEVPVSADIVDPFNNKTPVINVGNLGGDVISNAAISIFGSGGDNLLITDLDLSTKVRIGDTVEIDTDNDGIIDYEYVVMDINTVTGQITFVGGQEDLASIMAGTDINISVKAEPSTFAGASDQIHVTDHIDDTNSGGKDVVYITTDAYEADGFVIDPDTLYLIYDL